MARPLPETGQFETAIVDFVAWKRRALADERVTDAEGKELIQITERMVRHGNRLVRTIQFVVKVFTCKDGMASRTVRDAWTVRQAEIVQLDDYRDDPKTAA